MSTLRQANPPLPLPFQPIRWRFGNLHVKGVERGLKWLTPGLSVKRWLLVSFLGALEVILGLGIWFGFMPIHHLLTWLEWLVTRVTAGLPDIFSGLLIVTMGLVLMYRGQQQVATAIVKPFEPQPRTPIVDLLAAQRRRRRGPKIVAIGGGTGLSSLLKGLKEYSENVTAIVTVADDGGSSGRLRQTFGVQPPGDLRNCLAALAEEETLLTQLFQYRFESGDGLAGHSFGNLFLTAMTQITGDLEQAATASARVLATRGQVLPATLSDMQLWAEFEDGRRIQGESAIAAAGSKISRIGCFPEKPAALPAAVEAIAAADYIILGPGSLYTSIVPNLLVPDIKDAIANAKVPRIYVCNIMTQPGETTDYSVADHLQTLDQVCGQRLFDTVVVHQGRFSPSTLAHYAQAQSHPVVLDRSAIARLECRLVTGNVADDDRERGIRHHPKRLARTLFRAMQPLS